MGVISPREGRLKLDILALGSFRSRYVHAVTFHPSIYSFLIKQEEKGRSERNGIAYLTLKIETDRFTGVKGKYKHVGFVRELLRDFGSRNGYVD